MRVLLVDDHAIVREGLKRVLASMGDGVQVGEATNAARALHLARKAEWDCALVDIALPGKTGLELLKELRRERPALPVLVLSMFPEEQYAVRMLRAGASAYLNKESAPEQLVAAIRTVLRGEKYLSPSIAPEASLEFSKIGAEEPPDLTPRQMEVLTLIAHGSSTREVARSLNISVKTVETHRAQLMERLNIHDVAGLVRYAIKKGLVNIDK